MLDTINFKVKQVVESVKYILIATEFAVGLRAGEIARLL